MAFTDGVGGERPQSWLLELNFTKLNPYLNLTSVIPEKKNEWKHKPD